MRHWIPLSPWWSTCPAGTAISPQPASGEDLPQQARDYVEYLEKAVGCKITYISVGAEREAYIHRG